MIHNLLANDEDTIKVKLSVPVRVADIGGWIDTWFAKYGSVLNLSVWCKEYGTRKEFEGVEIEAEFSKTKRKKENSYYMLPTSQTTTTNNTL